MISRILMLFIGATGAIAQTAPPLSLDEAIRVAWAYDGATVALALTPELAKAREEQAGIRPNPELELTAATPTPLKNDSEWAVGIGASQRLPRRERIEQARAVARLGGAGAPLQIGEQRRRVAGEVRALYYDLVVQQAKRDRARRTLEQTREMTALLERGRTAGEIGIVEIEALSVEARRAEQALVFAEADLAAADARLRGRLRLAPGAPLVLGLGFDALLARPLPESPTVLEQARPTLALAAVAVQQAEAAVALARTESRPEWTVGGGVEFERRVNDYSGRLENDPRLSVRASVPWPRRVANRGEILEKQAALRVAAAERTALRGEVLAEISTALATVRALQPIVAARREPATDETRAADVFRAASARGEISAVQLTQARQQRLALDHDFIEAAGRYVAALAAAETAAGVVPAQP